MGDDGLDYNFGIKHRKYMARAYTSVINVAEGAVRAGKTIDNVFVFASLLEKSPDRIHLATGSTLGNAKINIGDCNGLGLERIFAGRFKWEKYRGNDSMCVKTAAGEKHIIFAGGKNSDSYKRIRGNSYGMWIATEINLHASNFIEEALNRTLAARDRRIFWDLNPSTPKAAIYRDHIDRYREMAEQGEVGDGFYNYGHFTIYDNPVISEERLSEIEAQYDKGSIWYRRDILGERCAAEGIIYRRFADSPAEFTADEAGRVDFIIIGIDFGGNRSKTAIVGTGIRRVCGQLEFVILRESIVSGEKGEIDPERINGAVVEFIHDLRRSYPGVNIRYIFADNEAQYLISGLRKHLRRYGEVIQVLDSIKKPIVDRISFVNQLMAQGRFHVSSGCTELISGLSSALWDESASGDKRLDNFTSDIDILDAMEYSIERYMG